VYSYIWALTVAHEPSIEWVVGADHSTVGRIGSHMVLCTLPWDSVERLSSMCTDWYNANDLMKLHVSIRVVRMWCEICTNLILRCFDKPEGLNYGNLLVGMVP
jgi:hypothetical protein